MKKMKAVQVNQSGGWETVEKDLSEPTIDQVRVKVEIERHCYQNNLHATMPIIKWIWLSENDTC